MVRIYDVATWELAEASPGRMEPVPAAEQPPRSLEPLALPGLETVSFQRPGQPAHPQAGYRLGPAAYGKQIAPTPPREARSERRSIRRPARDSGNPQV